MSHNLKITVAKKPKADGIVSYKKISVREKILRLLLGAKQDVMILVPGKTVQAIDIREEGGLLYEAL